MHQLIVVCEISVHELRQPNSIVLEFRIPSVDLQNKPITQPTTILHDDIDTSNSTCSSRCCSFIFLLLLHDARNQLSVLAWDAIVAIFESPIMVRRMVEADLARLKGKS